MVAVYERFKNFKTGRGTRIEALCLAVRALVAAQLRPAARKLLKTVEGSAFKKPAHYEFLGRAHLDLKQYPAAAAACMRAEELRVAQSN